jgi:hypothetical protein
MREIALGTACSTAFKAEELLTASDIEHSAHSRTSGLSGFRPVDFLHRDHVRVEASTGPPGPTRSFDPSLQQGPRRRGALVLCSLGYGILLVMLMQGLRELLPA